MLLISRQMASRGEAGFTLVEQLVVIAIVALTLAAIGHLIGSTSRGARRLEQRASLIQGANSLLAGGMPPRDGLAIPEVTGESSGQRWRIRLTPLEAEAGIAVADNSRWVPMRVDLLIQSSSEDAMRLQTIRLHRVPAQ